MLNPPPPPSPPPSSSSPRQTLNNIINKLQSMGFFKQPSQGMGEGEGSGRTAGLIFKWENGTTLTIYKQIGKCNKH